MFSCKLVSFVFKDLMKDKMFCTNTYQYHFYWICLYLFFCINLGYLVKSQLKFIIELRARSCNYVDLYFREFHDSMKTTNWQKNMSVNRIWRVLFSISIWFDLSFVMASMNYCVLFHAKIPNHLYNTLDQEFAITQYR